MRAGRCVDQLPGNAHPVTALAYRAFEHITNAEFTADALHIDCLALVGEARIAGDDEQPADARQRGDDLLDHAVDEIFLLRVAAHVLKWQDRDRRLVGERRRPWEVTLTRLAPQALDTLSRITGEGGPRRLGGGVGE